MAESSYFPTSNQYIKYQIIVTENSTSVANNTSSVTVKVIAWRTNQGYSTYGSGTCYCNINGTSYSQGINSSQYIEYNSDTVLFSQTVTIPHNADGTKSIFVEAKISHSRFSSDFNGFTVALANIPRQATLTAVQNFNDEQNPTITYSNPAGNAVSALDACISLTGSRDDVPYRAISKTGSSYTFNLTSAERTTLRNACANSNTLTVYFYVRTTIAGVQYWSNKPATMTIVNGNPTITGQSYKDNNASTVAITTNNQYIIQNQSQLVFNFSSLTALKSSTLKKLDVTINSVTKSMNLSGASMSNVSLTFGTIDTSSNATASVVVTDSRGNKRSINMTINVYEWKAPTAIVSATRQSNFYNLTTIYADASYSSLGGHNTISITWDYKLTTASTWTSGGSLSDGGSTVVNLDNESSWNVRFTIRDRIATTIYNVVVEIGIPIFFVDRNKRSVGIGTFPDETNELSVDRRLNIKNVTHDTVADLWSVSRAGGLKSCALFIRNGDNPDNETNVLARVTAFNSQTAGKSYGDVSTFNESGQVLTRLGTSSADNGFIGAYDSNGVSKARLSVGSSGRGDFWLGNSSGSPAVQAFAGNSDDGTLNVMNEYGNWTINMSGKAGTINLRDGSTTTIVCAGSTGNVKCVSLTQTSSRKVKENIHELSLEEALKILELVAVTFDYKVKEQGTDMRGFIAEDVADVIPELVTEETDETPASLNYVEMIPYLQKVIKDQQKRIDDLETRLKALEEKMDK